MNDYIAELTLDLDCRNTLPVIRAGQYDKGRKCLIHITANNQTYSAEGCTAVIKGKRHDKTFFSALCTVNGSGDVELTLNESILSVRGFTYAKIVLSDATRNYSTQMFALDVDSSFDGDVSEIEDFPLFNHCLNQMAAILGVDNPEERISEYEVTVAGKMDYAAAVDNDHPASTLHNGQVFYTDDSIGVKIAGGTKEAYTKDEVDRLIPKKLSEIENDPNGQGYVKLYISPGTPAGAAGSAYDPGFRQNDIIYYPSIGAFYQCSVFNKYTTTQAGTRYNYQVVRINLNTARMINDAGFLTAQDISGKMNLAAGDMVITREQGGSAQALPDVSALPIGQVFQYIDENDSDKNGYYIRISNSYLAAQQYRIARETTVRAMIEYVDEAVTDIKSYIGYTDSDIVGLQADFENKVFTRLGAAADLPAYDTAAHKASVEAFFDDLPMYGGRRRCNVSNSGTINAYYGDADYTEDGSNGQVMVYQPAFWYKVVPLKLEKNTTGLGHHIRKANYYVSATPKAGFKRHPLFYDASGNAVDYVLFSAYEGSMWDASQSKYIDDNVDTSVAYASGDMLCSVAGVKCVSGKVSGLDSKAKMETLAQNRGPHWHVNTMKALAANQLLMIIETGTFNMQNAIGRGVSDRDSDTTYNNSCYTGSTASLGSGTGAAASTTFRNNVVETADGKTAITYRGVENIFGDQWQQVNSCNIWGDGTMGGGQIYVSDKFIGNEATKTDFKATGISISNGYGWISAFGYSSADFDWLFIPSEASGGTSSLPVGDNINPEANVNGYKAIRYGGRWSNGTNNGAFYYSGTNSPNYAGGSTVGVRLLYV